MLEIYQNVNNFNIEPIFENEFKKKIIFLFRKMANTLSKEIPLKFTKNDF